MAPGSERRAASRLPAAIALALLGAASAQVDCGGHISDHCGNCPLDQDTGMNYAHSWCHGECKWIDPHFFGFGGVCLNKNLEDDTGGIINEYGFGFGTSAFMMLVFACCYKRKVVDKLPHLPRKGRHDGERKEGIFAMFKHPETCIYSFCCLPVVAAKNYHAAEVCPFWTGCLLMYAGTFSPFYIITAMIRAALSGRVRERLGYKPDLCKDCCCSVFCFPCEVGRESIEVDEELGVKVGCCYPHVELDREGTWREDFQEAAPVLHAAMPVVGDLMMGNEGDALKGALHAAQPYENAEEKGFLAAARHYTGY